MTRIRNIEELRKEKFRIQMLLTSQKAAIREDVQLIHNYVSPWIRSLLSGSPKKASVFNMGAIDLLAMGGFSRVGWITRIIAPMVLSSLTGTLIEKLRGRFSRKSI